VFAERSSVSKEAVLKIGLSPDAPVMCTTVPAGNEALFPFLALITKSLAIDAVKANEAVRACKAYEAVAGTLDAKDAVRAYELESDCKA